MRIIGGKSFRYASLAVLLCLLSAPCWSAGLDPVQEAGRSATGVLGRYGTPEGLNQGISVPMTGGGTITTPDGKGQAELGLECPASASFIVIAAEKDGFGRLAGVTISQDLDFDGVLETHYRSLAEVPVSGVCRNGVFSCNRGSLDNCHYYMWRSGPDGAVFLEKLGKEMETVDPGKNTREALGSCYCIANDCSRNFAAIYIESVVRDIGLGITEAVIKQKPRYVITEKSLVKSNLKDIRLIYQARDISRCRTGAAPGYPAGPPPEYLQGSYGALQDAAQKETLRQTQDPGSYYSLVASVPASGSYRGLHKCVIARKFVVSRPDGCDPADGREGDFCYLRDTEPHIVLRKTGGPDRGCHFTLEKCCSYSRFGVTMNAAGNFLCGDPSPRVQKAVRITYKCGGQGKYAHGREWEPLRIDCPSGDFMFVEGYYYTSAHGKIDCPRDYQESEGLRCRRGVPPGIVTGGEYIADECRVFSGLSGCRLRSEVVDGVQTVRDFQAGKPLPERSCREMSGERICRDWWEKVREYECAGASEFDFDEDLRRLGKTRESVAMEGDTFTYTSHARDAQGRETPKSVSTRVAFLGTYDQCDRACKTRVAIVDTTVNSETTRSGGGRTSTDSRETKYYKCESGKCPAPKSEQLLVDCSCIDDFPEAIAHLKVIEEVLDDADCSGKWKKDGRCQGSITFFKGDRNECLGGGIEALINCCDKESGRNIVEIRCKEEDVKTWNRNRNGLCHYVGDYCASRFMRMCTRKKETYCCFSSKLARIIAEQGRPQLKAFGSKSWGTAESPDCRGFTPEEFQQLDFSRIDLSEYTRDLQVNIPSEEEMKKRIKIPGK